MMAPRVLGLVAVAALLAACAVGRRALQRDPGLRKALAALLFCALAGLATSWIHTPLVVWPLALSMLMAMLFLVWTLHVQNKGRRS